jgi:outer membrane autotransporter protein
MNINKSVKISFCVLALLATPQIVIAAACAPNPLSGSLGASCTLPASLLTVTSSGTINGSVTNDAVVAGISNSGTISSPGSYGFRNHTSGSIATLSNSGTISANNSYAVANFNNGNITTLSNTGVISTGGVYSLANFDSANITTLINSGTISAVGFYSLANFGSASIGTLTNLGTISAQGFGLANFGVIGTLNNLQGSPTSALTYLGNLPTNYNIIINSPTSYGKLAVTAGTGTTTFGIYAGSTVANTTYSSVLSGVTATDLNNVTTGTYNSVAWALTETAIGSAIWDLIISGVSTPSASTYRSNALSLRKMQAAGAAGVLDSVSSSPGALSGVVTALNALSGTAQANAVAQTLPVITGAASQATTSSMQALNQVIQGRSSSLRGMSSGDEYIGNRDVWMKGFGSWANQNDINGVSGYRISTGGLAIGIDKGLSRKANLGAVFAFSNSGVSSNSSSSAPSGVTVNSYQVGMYGDYAIHPQLIANAQADIGMNQNNAYRNIAFMGTNANSSYNSYSGHVGTGVKYLMPINPENTFIPSVRVDYTTVQSQAYTETGAGALNLSVGQQTYNTLIPSADLRIDHSLDSKLTLSANAGAGYNTLGNQVTATAAYQGGGAVFATNGLQVSPWLYNAGVGITGQIEKNLQLNVRYDNVFSPTGYMNQMVSAKLKMPI